MTHCFVNALKSFELGVIYDVSNCITYRDGFCLVQLIVQKFTF